MGEEKLKQLIEELDVELENTDISDSNTREKLTELMADVRAKLEKPVNKEEHKKVAGALKETALKFEVSHPKVTKTLNEISNLLSNIGI